MPLEHRLQIVLDDERHRRISTAARERGVTVATIVCEAIDRWLGSPDSRLEAMQRLLQAPDTTMPEPGELREELEAARQRRA